MCTFSNYLKKVTRDIYVNIKSDSEALNMYFHLKKIHSVEIYYNRIYQYRIKTFIYKILQVHVTNILHIFKTSKKLAFLT